MSEEIALVTGASRGIGRAIALHLHSAGYRVIGAARRLPPDPPPDPSPDPSPGIDMQLCDVADAASVAALFDYVRRQYGKLHVLVNNAAIAGGAPFGSAAEAEEWGPMLAVNLGGPWACSRAARDLLVDGRGRVINIASVLGLRGVADQLAYCASKHGLIGLTRALARALGPRGITANAICPGWVDTEMARGRLKDLGMAVSQATAMIPTGRMTEEAEVAALVAFIASPQAGNLNGQAIGLEGGMMA